MTVKYLDPYKDDKYGKLKGDKSETYFSVTFSEAVVHKTDDAYIIAGQVGKYVGIIRGFKPELPLESGLCAVPIYGKEYEIRKKDKDGNWISEKITPSLFEKALYREISVDGTYFLSYNRQYTYLTISMTSSQPTFYYLALYVALYLTCFFMVSLAVGKALSLRLLAIYTVLASIVPLILSQV